MDRCRKRPDSDIEGCSEPEPPADKRPCTAEPSTSAAAAAAAPPPGARQAEQGGSDMDTSSSGHHGDADADVDADDGDGDGDEDGDGGSSCESDGDGSPRPRGSGGGKFQRMVDAVADEGAGQDAVVAALMELCEALSFCAEDAGGYFPTEAAARALVRRAAGGGADGTGATPDVILLSVRAITYLCDAMPRAGDAVVRHGLLPVLCSRLLAIEYLDVAEQCLQAFEKISRRQPTQCLQAGMINAVLAYIDFFAPSIQRVAVSAVANACKKAPADCSQFVLDSIPTLCNLLQSEDKMIVEKVAACLISIVDSFSTSVDLVDQLCHQGVIEKVLPLIHTGGLTALTPSTSSNLIGLLAKLACTSLVAVKSLFELGVSSTIKGILINSDISHGMPYLPLEKQNNQVNEALKLANQLIPSAARDIEDTQIILVKEKIITDEPMFLCQFSRDILPVLIKAVNSGANSYICYGCASIVNNICYFSKPEILQELLKETNIPSFLAGLLSRKDHHVLTSSLKIIEILMQKLPDAYLGFFIKEGVVNAVEALLNQEDCSKSTLLPDDMQQSETQPVIRNKTTCFCYAFDARRSEAAEKRTCRIGKDGLFSFARHVKTTYFTKDVSSEMGLTEILQKLKTCCAVLNETTEKSSEQCNLQNEEYLSTILSEVMMELHGGETMTTFEFLESGLVKSLSNYLSNGKYLQVEDNMKCSSDHFLAVVKRFQSFARMSFSRMGQNWGDMLLTLLVRKLQNALTSLDNFPVIMSHNFKPRSSISDIPTRHSTITPCIRVRFKKDEDETNLSSYDSAVSVEISSSLHTIEEFLWPKVSIDVNSQKAESPPSDTALESKYADDSSQEQDSTPSQKADSPSEGLTCENQNTPVETCPKQGTSSSGQAERNTAILSDNTIQQKLVFSLNGKELDRSVTLYQSILQDQINAGSDIILDMQFWRSVHDITFRSASPEANDSPRPSSAAISLINDNTTGFTWQMLPFFSSMLLGKLPCKLDRSGPSYDILFMLHILEGLNRYSFHLVSDERNHSFAHGKITNLDDLKAEVISIPQQEFVSAKLTDKLEQQMHDPLVSRSCCLPLWCTELMSSCPFLFSFEARWKYFQLTAFGSLKYHHGHMMDATVNSVVERGSSHSRKKFKVDRDDIFVSAAKMMKSHAKSNALLEVEYIEEVGTGLGPTMEFYTLISHEFQKSGLGMWRGELPCESGTNDAHVSGFVVAPNGLFPRPWSASADSASFQEVSKRFHLLGLVVAKAIKDNRILDIPFSKAFYKLILGQELNIYDIQSLDSELAISLVEFQALACRRKYAESNLTRDCLVISDLTYRGCRIEDLAIEFALPGYPEYVLSSGSPSDSLNVENLEEYVRLVVDATVKSGIARQMEAFKSGFNEVFPLNKLQVFSEDELERILCGEQDTWDFAKLVDHIKFDHGYTSSSPPVINLLEIIQEFGSLERRAFLQFITGSPRLPPGGLAALNPKFTVVRKHNSNDADDDLPSVMTCANYLKLPPYSSKEKRTGRVIGTGVRRDGLWLINHAESALAAAVGAKEREIFLLHRRLGHFPFEGLSKLYPDDFKDVDRSKLVCDACELGKHTRSTYPSIGLRSCEPFMLIHSDVWGPCSVTSVSGFKWFVTFIDCYTRMTWIYMMRGKHEVLKCFQDFHKLVTNQFDAKIRIIRTDNGKEYVNNDFGAYLSHHGIIHQTTCPNTPPQNGVAERKNRHLLEVARSLMFQMNIPKYLWSEAVMTAAYLINRMPSRILGMKSPAELLLGQREFKVPPRVFGCVCFVRDHRPSVGKLDPQAVKCVFVGYSSTQKGYKCWDPIGKKLFVSMDVTFREFEPYYTKPWDLDPLLEEFSSVTEGDSREGENGGVASQKEVIVGTIPCPMIVSRVQEEVVDQNNVEDMRSGGHEHGENRELIGDESEEVIVEESEETIGRTNPCLAKNRETKEPIVYQRRQFRSQGEQITEKEPIVYQRKRFRSQGEQVGEQVDTPQSQQPVSPVPNLSSDSSPLSSSTHSGSGGNVSPTPEHVELPLAQRRDTRSNFGKPPVRYGFEHPSTDHDIANFLSYSRLSPAYRAFVASLQTVPIPRDWRCAKQDPKWKAAMEEEMHALQKNKTWELVPLPKGKRAVGCKWVFTVKQNPKGEVDRYKARLVAKGYSQTYGIDYDETFAPVAKMGTVRTLISCAVNFGWPLHQMDVKNAFLHGDLQEEVYMEIPPGFANSQTIGKVCKLKKSLYGLKQSPRAWFDRFRRAVCGMGYTQCNGDHTVFYKHRGTFITIMAVYVDDIVITGDDVEEIKCLKENLGKAFEVKDLGPLRYFLGIEIARSPKGIVLSQRKYVLDLLTETGMLGCRPCSTPIDKNHQISAQCGDSVNKEIYQRLVGRLIYLCHTRPDISYAVSVVSRYMHDPRAGHMEVVYRILRYLKGTPGRGLWFRKNGHLDLEGYCDADWASSKDDRRSTSGYCVFVGGNLVSWRSKKQAVVARSTAEAEYRAMALSLCEMLWLKGLLKELRVLRNETMMLHCDNVAAINIANNPVQFDRTKHVEIDRFFIKEKLDSGVLKLKYVKSRDQLADCLTKGLGPSENELSCSKMGMLDIFSPS